MDLPTLTIDAVEPPVFTAGQPNLFPDMDLVDLARGWEPAERRDFAHTGTTLSRNERLCAQVCEAVLLKHSVRRIARSFGVSRHSVTAIMGVLEARGKVEPIKRRLSGKLGVVAELCVDNLIEGAEDNAIPYNVAAVAMGIALDKKALLDAEPAALVVAEVQEELRIEHVNRLVAGLGFDAGSDRSGGDLGADKKGSSSDSESDGKAVDNV